MPGPTVDIGRDLAFFADPQSSFKVAAADYPVAADGSPKIVRKLRDVLLPASTSSRNVSLKTTRVEPNLMSLVESLEPTAIMPRLPTASTA